MRRLEPRLLSGIVALGFLSGCASSGGSSEAVHEPGVDEVVIQGRVMDSEQLPLSGANVTLERANNLTVVAEAVSDEGGAYSLPAVPMGEYLVRAKLAGFSDLHRAVNVRTKVSPIAVDLVLAPIPVAEAYHHSIPRTLTIQYGVAWHVGGDFNQGCIYEGVTCQAVSYPSANVNFLADDPKGAPLTTIVLEESWTSTSPVCAKAIAIDVYNPDAPSVYYPNLANPHYWTNYPHAEWKTSSPVTMVIPRDDLVDEDSMNHPKRLEKNDNAPLLAKGNWTVRNFPPGRGLTNQPVDANCFTDQKFDLWWTNFYLEAAPTGFTARGV